MLYLTLIIIIIAIQIKINKDDSLIPIFFSIIVYIGYIHIPFIESTFNIELLYDQRVLFEEYKPHVVRFAFECILMFNLGYIFITNKKNNDHFLHILNKDIFKLSQKSIDLLSLVHICLLLFDITVFALSVGNLQSLWLSNYERGTFFGISQHDRSGHYFINVILTLKNLSSISLFGLDYILLSKGNKRGQSRCIIHLIYSFVSAFYSQAQSILLPTFIISCVLIEKKKFTIGFLSTIAGILLSYVFRTYRMLYNSLGLLISLRCINDFVTDDDISNFLLFDPLNCSQASTYIFGNIDLIFSSYFNSFIQLLYNLSPFYGTSSTHELAINVISADLGLDYGLPTPCLAQIYGGFKHFGSFFFFFVGIISKLYSKTNNPTLKLVFYSCIFYSFILLDHSNIRAFWRFFSMPIYLSLLLYPFHLNDFSFLKTSKSDVINEKNTTN